jgi:integrase
MPTKKLTQKFIDSIVVTKPTAFTDSTLTGFQLTVSPAGSKTYYYKFSQRGRQIKRNLGKHPVTTLKDAKSNYLKLYEELNRGVNQSHKRMSVRDFFDSYYKPYLLAKNKSARDSFNTLENHFLSWMGDKAIEDITVSELALWRDKRISSGISPNTVKRNLTEIKAMFNYLSNELGFLAENPLVKLKSPKEVEAKKKLYLTKDEYKRVLDTVSRYIDAFNIYTAPANFIERDFTRYGVNNRYELVLKLTGLNIRQHVFPYYLPVAINIALFTGLRKSEIFGLRWSDFDFTNRLLTLQATQTKAQRRRVVALSEKLVEELLLLERATEYYVQLSPNAYVFPVRDTKKAMARFQKETGLDYKIGWHHFRHNFASTLVLKEVPLHLVMSLMGHSKLETTQRYLSVRTDDLKGAVAVLDEVILP